MPLRSMIELAFENFNSFNPEEDAYIFNYNTPFIYNYDSYISNVLYYIDGSNKEISDIEEEEDDE